MKAMALKGMYFQGVETTGAFNTRGQADVFKLMGSTCTVLTEATGALPTPPGFSEGGSAAASDRREILEGGRRPVRVVRVGSGGGGGNAAAVAAAAAISTSTSRTSTTTSFSFS